MEVILSGIVAVISAIPAIKSFFDQLVTFYVQQKVDTFKAEDRAAIQKAMEDQDQRDIEKELGSTHAGELSGIPGTEVRPTLPGVKP